MAERCGICLEDLDGDRAGVVHAACARQLYGTPAQPEIEVDPAELHLFGQQMVGHTTISGVLGKLSLGWAQKTLRVRAEHYAFILKPQSSTYAELPENEHASLRLAGLAEIETAVAGLALLRDGRRALVVRRFDRTPSGRRIAMEDFCQLCGLLPKQKYAGSGELCARTIRQFSTDPGPDLLRLFRQFVFAWWIANGDMHLKNLALLEASGAGLRLSPAFDLVSTVLLLPGDQLALAVAGKRARFKRRDWQTFGAYCRLPEKLVQRELGRFVDLLPDAQRLVERSFLSPEKRAQYAAGLEERTRILRAAA